MRTQQMRAKIRMIVLLSLLKQTLKRNNFSRNLGTERVTSNLVKQVKGLGD